MNTHRRTPRRAAAGRRRRGTALLEMALCFPLLATVIVSTMFLGWAMMNQQHVKASARYAAWRGAYGRSVAYDTDDPNAVADAYRTDLNSMFFRQEAISVNTSHEGVSDAEFEQWISASYSHSNYAGIFADQLLLNAPSGYGHFPHSSGRSVTAEFSTNVEAFQKAQGPIYSLHVRDGVEWRKDEADCRHAVRIDFLDELDTRLQQLDAEARNAAVSDKETMASRMRGLYLHGWHGHYENWWW